MQGLNNNTQTYATIQKQFGPKLAGMTAPGIVFILHHRAAMQS